MDENIKSLIAAELSNSLFLKKQKSTIQESELLNTGLIMITTASSFMKTGIIML
jgi:hypothetical protein